jgi:hypothetical protein
MARQRRNAPTLLLGVALFLSGLLLIALCWNYTFFQDAWATLLYRQGFSAHDFLMPHNEHLVVFQVAVEKLFIEVFGMTTARPAMLFMTATLLTAGALMFVYVRRRVGPWLALFAAVSLLFLGSAWPVLLWPFEIEFAAPIAAGLGMLLMLEREDRAGDIWACVLLIVAIGFGSLGISFAAAALVDLYLKRRTRGWGRAWVAVVPLVLYVAWYFGWGHEAERHMTLHNVLMSPAYTFEGFATAVGSLAGLSTTPVTSPGQPEWGRPLLIALIGLAIYGQRRRPGVSPTFWPVAAASLSYWLLAAFNFIPGREAASTRYVYAGAAFVLLLAAELLRGVTFSRRALWISASVTILAVLPNLAQMKDGADWMKEQSILTRADTAALDISADTVPSSFSLNPEIAGTASLAIVDAGRYFEAVSDHGSPAYSPGELEKAPEVGRRWADVVLSQALPLSTESEAGKFDRGAIDNCTVLQPGTPAPPEGIELSPGLTRIEVAPGPEAKFHLRRFAAAEFPVPTTPAPGESTTLLRIPRDRASQPWWLQVEAQQLVRVCR